MGFKFSVNSEKLADLGLDLNSSADKLVEYNDLIYKKIAELGSIWSGPSYEAFVASSEKYRTSLESLPALFKAYASKVGEYDVEADNMICTVESLLEMKGVSKASYSLASTSADTGIAVEYKIDSFDKAGDAESQAEKIQLNLQADLEVIDTELRSIAINLAALEQKKSSMDINVYNEAVAALMSQKNSIEQAREEYRTAKAQIDELLRDSFWFWEEDGALVEASDAWFGLENDQDMANEGVAKLNEALKNLTPVDVLCETSCVNGLYAISGEDYMVESFYDGPHVSKYAMMASYSIAEKSNSTLTDSNNSNVTYFNSKGFITDGLLASGYNYDSTDRTFSQFDAYSNTECGPEDYQGYDSVRIKTTDENGDESFVYMTYGQYVNSKYYKE